MFRLHRKLLIPVCVALVLVLAIVVITVDSRTEAAQATANNKARIGSASSLFRVLRGARASSKSVQRDIARANGYIAMAPNLELDPTMTRLIDRAGTKLFVLAGQKNVCLQAWEGEGESSGMTCDEASAIAEKDVLILSGKDKAGHVNFHGLVRDGITAVETDTNSDTPRRLRVSDNVVSGQLPVRADLTWTRPNGERRSHGPLAGLDATR